MHRHRARIHQQKTAGAVGVLSFAGLEASLTNQGGLLVAKGPGNRNTVDRRELFGAVDLAAGTNLRKHRFGNSKRAQNVLVPREDSEIQQLRAARVRYIGDVDPSFGPASQLPEQKCIDVAEKDAAGFRLRSNTWN